MNRKSNLQFYEQQYRRSVRFSSISSTDIPLRYVLHGGKRRFLPIFTYSPCLICALLIFTPPAIPYAPFAKSTNLSTFSSVCDQKSLASFIREEGNLSSKIIMDIYYYYYYCGVIISFFARLRNFFLSFNFEREKRAWIT